MSASEALSPSSFPDPSVATSPRAGRQHGNAEPRDFRAEPTIRTLRRGRTFPRDALFRCRLRKPAPPWPIHRRSRRARQRCPNFLFTPPFAAPLIALKFIALEGTRGPNARRATILPRLARVASARLRTLRAGWRPEWPSSLRVSSNLSISIDRHKQSTASRRDSDSRARSWTHRRGSVDRSVTRTVPESPRNVAPVQKILRSAGSVCYSLLLSQRSRFVSWCLRVFLSSESSSSSWVDEGSSSTGFEAIREVSEFRDTALRRILSTGVPALSDRHDRGARTFSFDGFGAEKPLRLAAPKAGLGFLESSPP
jgi:hypothetical protein